MQPTQREDSKVTPPSNEIDMSEYVAQFLEKDKLDWIRGAAVDLTIAMARNKTRWEDDTPEIAVKAASRIYSLVEEQNG